MCPKKILQSRKEILWEFRVILALEEKAARVYHQLSEDCDDREVKDLLESISQDEHRHVSIAKTLISLVERSPSRKRGVR